MLEEAERATEVEHLISTYPALRIIVENNGKIEPIANGYVKIGFHKEFVRIKPELLVFKTREENKDATHTGTNSDISKNEQDVTGPKSKKRDTDYTPLAKDLVTLVSNEWAKASNAEEQKKFHEKMNIERNGKEKAAAKKGDKTPRYAVTKEQGIDFMHFVNGNLADLTVKENVQVDNRNNKNVKYRMAFKDEGLESVIQIARDVDIIRDALHDSNDLNNFLYFCHSQCYEHSSEEKKAFFDNYLIEFGENEFQQKKIKQLEDSERTHLKDVVMKFCDRDSGKLEKGSLTEAMSMFTLEENGFVIQNVHQLTQYLHFYQEESIDNAIYLETFRAALNKLEIKYKKSAHEARNENFHACKHQEEVSHLLHFYKDEIQNIRKDHSDRFTDKELLYFFVIPENLHQPISSFEFRVVMLLLVLNAPQITNTRVKYQSNL